MRILLIGSPPDRARLRAQLNGSFEIAGEFATLAAARAADTGVEAMLLAGGTHRSAGPVDDEDGGFDERLTGREVQVLELLAEGLPNKAIATRLGISDQTVKFHVASITGKLGAANRTDAVRRAVRRGLITL
jgi:DNA-binding NarL/FixJ family response regulator